MFVDFKARSLDKNDDQTTEHDGNILVPGDDGVTEFFHLAHSDRASGGKEWVDEEKEVKQPQSWTLIVRSTTINSRYTSFTTDH